MRKNKNKKKNKKKNGKKKNEKKKKRRRLLNVSLWTCTVKHWAVLVFFNIFLFLKFIFNITHQNNKKILI